MLAATKTKTNIYFSPFNMTLSLLLFVFCCFGSPIMLTPPFIDALQRGKGAAIMFLILLFCLSLIMLPFFFVILRCFIALLKKQPAIEMTSDYYIDNVEQVKIVWGNISDVYILQLIKDSYLKVAVINEDVVYSQAKNALYKYMFRSNAKNGGILSINLSFLKGRNKDIVNTIADFHQRAINL